MRRRVWLALCLLLALVLPSALAEEWEHDELGWPEVQIWEGDAVALSGTLSRELQEETGEYAVLLELDQPLDFYMMYDVETFSEALLTHVQVIGAKDLSDLLGAHVLAMGNVSFGGAEGTYCAVVISNASAVQSDSFASIAEIREQSAESAPAAETSTAVSYHVRATASVNVRTGPGLGYSDVGTLTKGEEVEFLDEAVNDSRGVTWYKIQYYSFGTAWVSSVYSTLVEANGSVGVASTDANVQGNYVKATGGQSNVRTGPGLGYTDIGTLYRNETAAYRGQSSVDERGVRWYAIRFNGRDAWVSSRYTTLMSGSVSYPSVNLSWSSGTQYVRATGRVNVRKGPGLGYASINTMAKNEQVAYLGTASYDDRGVLWYKVQYYSYGTAWVSSVYSVLVNDSRGAGVASTDQAVTGSYVKATGGKSNIRSGPALGYTDLGTLQKGESAAYLGQSSVDERGVRWYYIEYEGIVGWISSRYTTLY